jgi:hypothetical protein
LLADGLSTMSMSVRVSLLKTQSLSRMVDVYATASYLSPTFFLLVAEPKASVWKVRAVKGPQNSKVDSSSEVMPLSVMRLLRQNSFSKSAH